MRILVVEDEEKVSAFLRQGLEEQGFVVDVVSNARSCLDLIEPGKYHLILMDVLLPGMNGNLACKEARKIDPKVHIIMLTALGSLPDKLDGFKAGCDDYIIKPFEFSELLARIKALSKRIASSGQMENLLIVGEVELDLDKKRVRRGSKEVLLSAKEFALLEFFMRNKGRVISRSELAENIWEITFDSGTNVVDVYVNMLRKKIDQDFSKKMIQTRIGMGYTFQEE